MTVAVLTGAVCTAGWGVPGTGGGGNACTDGGCGVVGRSVGPAMYTTATCANATASAKPSNQRRAGPARGVTGVGEGMGEALRGMVDSDS